MLINRKKLNEGIRSGMHACLIVKLMFFILLISCFSPASLNSQTFSIFYFENEEDLLEGLDSGDIDYETYVDLLQLMREKVDLNGNELYRLQEIPGVTRFEEELIKKFRKEQGGFTGIDELAGIDGLDYQRIRAFVKVGYVTGTTAGGLFEGRVTLQTEFDISEDVEREDEIRLKTKAGGDWSIYFDLELEDDDLSYWQRRYIEYRGIPGLNRIVAGTYSAKFGEGLVVGKSSLLPQEYRELDDETAQFLYNRTGRYNGIFINGEYGAVRPSFLFSYNRYREVSDLFTAADFSMDVFDNIESGITISHTRLASTGEGGEEVENVAGLHVEADLGAFSLFGEAASLIEKNGFGFYGGIQAGQQDLKFHMSFRDYGEEFAPVHGGGYARSDDIDLDLFSMDDEDSTLFSFPTDHAGETGFLMKSSYKLMEQLELNLALDQWGTSLDGEADLSVGGGLRWRFRRSAELLLNQKWRDYGLYVDGDRLVSTSMELRWKPAFTSGDIKTLFLFKQRDSSTYTHMQRYGYWWVRADKIPFGPLILGGRLKISTSDFKDQNSRKIEWYLEEWLILKKKFSISARFRQILDKNDTGSWENEMDTRLKVTTYF